jgi:hypothetical protein
VSALAVTGLAAAGLLVGAGSALAQDTPSCGAPAVSGGTATVTCAYTGAAQYWTVPGGVTQATFTLYGAKGGAGGYSGSGSGGLGAEVSAAFPVTSGTVLRVNVGQAGSSGGGGTFGGGGAGNYAAGSGGGASDIISPASDGSYPFGNALLVAGGGGGGAPAGNGAVPDVHPGANGGTAGSPGATGSTATGTNSTLGGGGGGGAGTATASGSGGAKGSLTGSGLCQGDSGEAGKSGTAGSQGAGGSGGDYGGGGGGGGYYGGGGGGGAATDGCGDEGGPGSGGGGSSYTGGVSGATVQDDVAAPSGAPDGEVIISYSYVAPSITTSSLPDATVGSAYSQDLSASSGTSPYSWSVTSGSLPAGLSLASDGTISGTPASAGTSTFTVQVTDSGNPAQTATQQLTLTVDPAAGGGTSCQTTATSFISADCYDASQGTIDVTAATGDSNPSGVDGNQVAQLANGDYLEYNNINFGSGSTQFDAQVASGAAGGVSGLVEVVLDNPGNTPVGSFAVASTGGWNSWKMIPANISAVTGVHNVYLEFVSGATGNPAYVSLHYFDFPVS